MTGSSRPHEINRTAEKPYFLSVDLSTARMGLLVMDESLDVIFGEEVRFDSDLPEYGTQNGCHTDGEVSTSPTHLHVKALDILLQKVSSQVELKRVKCICGSAQQHGSAWWSKAAPTLLSRLAPHKPLHEQLSPEQTWTLPNPPNFYDMSTGAQAQSLEWMIGGSEQTARRTGVRAFCRFTGVQIMKIQQTCRNILEATERISSASSFLSSLFLGNIAPLSEGDAVNMNLWNIEERQWDPLVLSLVMGQDSSKPGMTNEVNKLLQKLGEPSLDNSVPLGPIANYFVRRYGFPPDCQIAAFVGHHQATFMSQRLKPQDAVISLGDCDSDSVVLPLPRFLPESTRQILPNPVCSQSDSPSASPLVALFEYKDADLARHFMRDTYCNASWHTFYTLVTLIAEGGTIGLDDKLYTFFWPHGELGSLQGISRFEGGQRIKEFKDLRANPRSLLESQFLKMRLQLARINQEHTQLSGSKETLPPAYSLLGFDPYDHSVLPSRIIVMGQASENRVMVELLSSVTGAPVYQSVSLSPSTYSTIFSGNQRAITPAALGSCYKATWTHIRRVDFNQSFDDFLSGRLVQRSKRLRGQDSRNPPLSVLAASLASLGAPEASVQSTQDQQNVASFININATPGIWNQDISSSESQNDTAMLIVPLPTDQKDAEDGLIKVAEPDEDLFQRYGGQVEEFARLENFVRRGVL